VGAQKMTSDCPDYKEVADKASRIVSNCIRLLRNEKVGQDYAAYLLMSAGLGLAIMNNRNSPIVVNQLLSAAMAMANQNIISMEEEDEEDEKKYH
tara:strand:- start:1449 stop:1733 length:285 start_codon:yes stop_codon:yes gene_type:complete